MYKKTDPSTHKWKDLDKLTVWTQPSGGRGHGWDPKAVDPFKAYVESIQKFRKEDAARSYAVLKTVQGWAREKHSVTGGPTNKLKMKARVPTMQENLKEEQPQPVADSSLSLELNCESDDDYGLSKGSFRL